jgi:hypothetical protein
VDVRSRKGGTARNTAIMSSSAAKPRDGKEKKGVDKVLFRMKTVFHRKGASSRKGQQSAVPAEAPPFMR